MKTVLPLISGLALVLLTSVAFAKKDKSESTVEILHKPDGAAVILRINISALGAHAAHGDCLFDNSEEPPPARNGEGVEIPYCDDFPQPE